MGRVELVVAGGAGSARLAAAMLDAHGIPAEPVDGGGPYPSLTWVGGERVRVDEADADRARDLLTPRPE